VWGDRQEPEVGTQGREKVDMVLVVDAAGGHYRDHRELRVLGEWGWRGSVWSVKCGVWGVEGGGWSGGEVRSGKVRGERLGRSSFPYGGAGGSARQIVKVNLPFHLPPSTTLLLSPISELNSGQRSVSTSVQPLFAFVKCAARAARQGELNLIGQPRLIGRMRVETSDID